MRFSKPPPVGQVDIANVVLYKSGTTLAVVDTGGTVEFTAYLDSAAAQLAPYEEVLLVTSHGHADHVGNNAWVDTLGVPVTHLMSAHDIAAMRDGSKSTSTSTSLSGVAVTHRQRIRPSN